MPNDIVIKDCRLVDHSFHARYDVKSKIYHYKILNRKVPRAIGRQYAWFIRRKLDIPAMRNAIACIVGAHDFKSFEGTGSPRSHAIRNVSKADLTEDEDGFIIFSIEADGFLRYMVRNIVGTLVNMGLGKITATKFKDIDYLALTLRNSRL